TLATTIAVMSEGELQQLGSPDDIYERPAYRFVAECVGNLPINIVELQAGSTNPLTAWICGRLADLPLSVSAGSVGIRPEHVRLVSVDTSSRSATIIDIVPTGGSWIVELSADGEKFFAITPEPPGMVRGEQVGLSVAHESLHIF